MVNFVDTVNKKFTDIMIRKTITRIVSTSYDNPHHQYICSNIVFKGFLIEMMILQGYFSVSIIEGSSSWTLERKLCNYSLINFIRCVREWLTHALNNDSSFDPCKVDKRIKVQRFSYCKVPCLTMQQQTAVDNAVLGLSYL